jgi:hypothetical protein
LANVVKFGAPARSRGDANPTRHDVTGAPVRIGARVLIVASDDETFDAAYLGKVGIVKYLEYGCGCGQSFPSDPMIGVEFENGTIEEFWAEETAAYTPD